MTYEEELKELQAGMTRRLQQDMREGLFKAENGILKAQKSYFLVSLISRRRLQGLSQLQLAVKTGMQQPVIARIESGHGNPSLRTLLKIAQALDTNLSM